MFIAIILAALAVWAIVAAAVAVRRDGYRRVPTDWSRVHDTEPRAWQMPAAQTQYR